MNKKIKRIIKKVMSGLSLILVLVSFMLIPICLMGPCALVDSTGNTSYYFLYVPVVLLVAFLFGDGS